MNTLVTGIFETEHQAGQAVRKLVKSCVPTDFVRTIHSTAGRARRSNDTASEPSGVVKVAVKAREFVAQKLAIKILRDYGARHIECVSPGRQPKSRVRVRVSLRNQHAPASV